jgi:hypothetical protein
VAARVAELLALATAAAVASGHPHEVLHWLDRQRALAGPRTEGSWTPTELARRLRGRTLLHFGVDGETLVAVSVAGARVRLHRLGPLGAARSGLDRLHVALRTGCGGASAARALQERILTPVGLSGTSEGLVIVGVPELAGVCWAELPGCRGVPVSVAPSVAAWLHADAREREGRSGPAVWVAGPGLDHAESEVAALAARHGGQSVTGQAARVASVRTALDGAALAHLAAHGTVRGAHPGIGLADGELRGDELDMLDRVPEVVVLSACGMGASPLPAALLAKGARAVIAGVADVRDESVSKLMLACHEHLAAGLPAATALARAQRNHGPHGFNVYGA